MRRIPLYAKVVWAAEALLLFTAMFTPWPPGQWVALIALLWFVGWEASGIISERRGDTLSELCWKILAVRDHMPVNKALYPLVMGFFGAAVVLFVRLAWWWSGWPGGVGALCFAVGVYMFLLRHIRRGDSL